MNARVDCDLRRWLQSVGDASYSIYLSHVAVMEVIQHALRHMSHDLAPHLLYLVLLMGGTLMAGFALHLQVERRLMAWSPGQNSPTADSLFRLAACLKRELPSRAYSHSAGSRKLTLSKPLCFGAAGR